ncbi:MAG: hypothetical protein M3Y20_08365 [Actinomycetota bacterium]|nr:hypothetical protein [Actinomycetota bacterium]
MRVRLALGLTSLVVLVGCSGAPDVPVASYVPELPAQGPLEEYVGWSHPEGAAGVVEQLRLRESRIAACMTELGFEYVPHVPATDEVIEGEGPAQGTREYVELYGYGTWNPGTDEAGSFQFDYEPSAEREQYLAAMSPSELEAYQTAMYGPVTQTDPDGSVTREGGCLSVGHDGIAAGDEYARTVMDDAIAFLAALPEDPAFAELDARWSECMAGEGMSFGSPHRARASFSDALVAYFMDLDQVEGDPLATPEARERAVEEMRVALADLECRESLDYDREHTLIAHELQAAYVEEHLADLDLLAKASAR